MIIVSAFARALIAPLVLLAARLAYHQPLSTWICVSLVLIALATFGIYVRGRELSPASRYSQALLVCFGVASYFAADAGNHLTVEAAVFGLAIGMLIIGGDDLIDRVWPSKR